MHQSMISDFNAIIASLIGMILMAVVFLAEELWTRWEPANPLRPDSITNAFLEKRYRHECPCGKSMVTYDPYVLAYRCLSCRITRATRAIKLMLVYLGFAAPQPDCGQNAATAVAVTTDAVEKR